MKNLNRYMAIFGIVINVQVLLAQPVADWKKEYWNPTHPITGAQTQNQSDEDWFYYHKISLDASNNQNGYICVGYSGYVNYAADEVDGCYDITTNIHFQNADCDEFETALYKRGGVRSTMSFVDLNGNRTWERDCLEGYFLDVIQTSDGGFVAIGDTRSTKTLNGNLLYYNPNETAGNVTNSFSASSGSCFEGENQRMIQLVKLDNNGNILWQYIYGMAAYTGNGSTTYDVESNGRCLVETPEGNILIGGYAYDTGTLLTRSFLMQVGSNGYFNWKKFYGATNVVESKINAIARKGTGINTLYVAAGEETPNGSTSSNGFAFVVDNSNSPNPIWPLQYYGDGPINSRVTDVDFNIAGEIILPVGINCNCNGIGTDQATGKVYRINSTNGNQIGVAADLVNTITAYDLKIGIIHTQDGGCAVVSTRLPSAVTTPVGCYDLTYWRTDAFVTKLSATNVIEWQGTYDSESIIPAGPYSSWTFPDPNLLDVKRQECVYSISQDQDGGFTVAGNTSSNFDDAYLLKLHTVCTDANLNNITNVNSIQNYTVTGNITANIFTIIVNGNVTFKAGSSINLKDNGSMLDGFKCTGGGQFRGYIDPTTDCTPNFLRVANTNVLVASENTDNLEKENPTSLLEKTNILLIPNPNNGEFQIKITSENKVFGVKKIEIFDVMGKIIWSTGATENSNFNINISNHPNGLYYVIVTDNLDKIKTTKLIKQ